MANPLDAADLRPRVQAAIDAEIARQREVLAELGPEVLPVVEAVVRLMRGGKRYRAGFCHVGYVGTGGSDGEAIVRLASAMELFQAAALLHDDVMDASDLRRGAPTAHRALAQQHRETGLLGDPDRFGEAGAILAGDLCLNWSDEMVATCGLPAEEIARGRVHFDRMRCQLMAGQFLDVLSGAQDWDAMTPDQQVARARQVVRYKSAKYSVEQPLLIGAAAAGADDATLAALSAYGLALGEAFQLRDDVLGVFGDPELTGKPAGDDLREGKRTVLVAYTLQMAEPADRQTFRDSLGKSDLTVDEVARCRGIITVSGALDRLEDHISSSAEQARASLADAPGLTDRGRHDLLRLVEITTRRDA